MDNEKPYLDKDAVGRLGLAPGLAELSARMQESTQNVIDLTASQNSPSLATLMALATFTRRNNFGYPKAQDPTIVARRPSFYLGREADDKLYVATCDKVREIFGYKHVNLQALSGSLANKAVIYALRKQAVEEEKRLVIFSMSFSTGGHFSHGVDKFNTNAEGNLTIPYFITGDGVIDYDRLEKMISDSQISLEKHGIKRKEKFALIIGGSSYPRELDYKRVARIGKEYDVTTWADIAQISGLIAGGMMKNPHDFGIDIVTSSTHKTLRSVRGGIIMTDDAKLSGLINDMVSPGIQAEPDMGKIAALYQALHETKQPDFRLYAHNVIRNARIMADTLRNTGANIVSGGTDDHIVWVDLRPIGLKGDQAEEVLKWAGILTNRQAVPGEQEPIRNSGIRLGTADLTTRMQFSYHRYDEAAEDMQKLGETIAELLIYRAQNPDMKQTDPKVTLAKMMVDDLTDKYPSLPSPVEVMQRLMSSEAELGRRVSSQKFAR